VIGVDLDRRCPVLGTGFGFDVGLARHYPVLGTGFGFDVDLARHCPVLGIVLEIATGFVLQVARQILLLLQILHIRVHCMANHRQR